MVDSFPAVGRRKVVVDQPNLGLATTRQLLDELRARIEVHCQGGLDYRTVDGGKKSTGLNRLAR